MKIPLPRPQHYVVIGVNPALVDFVETLIVNAVPPAAITVILDSEHRPAEADRLSGVHVIELPSADERLLAAALEGVAANICCVFGWYSIFSRGFVENFHGPVFNLHVGELPLYRGAGGYSWQVLNDARTLRADVHLLVPRVDAGPIVCSDAAEVEVAAPYPGDYIRLSRALAVRTAVRFAELSCSGTVLLGSEQDESAAEYYPKLTTLRNGVVDFSWSVVDLDRFVRAFSDPYPGAMFSYRGGNYRVTRCEIVKNGISRHPFCRGLIVNHSDAGLHVMLTDGVIAFRDIRQEGGSPVNTKFFTIGDRLYTDPAAQLSALRFRPGRDD